MIRRSAKRINKGMRQLVLIPLLLLANVCRGVAEPMPPDPRNQSMKQLEARLDAIGDELDTLARYSPRSGSGSIGYRSQAYATDDQHEWVEIAFDAPKSIDEVVLVPTLRHDSESGFQADGFPAEFRVWAGTREDRTGELIAQISLSPRETRRVAPLIVPVEHNRTAWVQIEVTRMTRRASDGKHALQLTEIMIFNGSENVGLRQSASASSTGPDNSGAWDVPFLVDGHTPYLMNAADGRKSQAYVGLGTEPPSILIDLGKPEPISRIHLHAVDQTDTVPQAYFSDFGMPRHLRIEGAKTSLKPDPS